MIRRLVLFILLFQTQAFAETPEERGLAIAQKIEQREDSFEDVTVHMQMILHNRHGEESRRELQVLTLEMPDDGDKSVSIFDEPRDIKGTALLTFSHKTGADDQWLFLPALKRVKRIASADKSGSFMGSEFAYEDIASQEVEKYTYKYLGDEPYEGADCFKVERYPVDRYSGYKRQQVWIDKAEYRVMKVDYYDRKESLLKRLTFHSYRKYLDQYWRPDEMRMVNHQNGKSTRLLWSDYQFRKGLNRSDFTPEGLKRAR
jgi:outer membrane lipoprotein-sorting protein